MELGAEENTEGHGDEQKSSTDWQENVSGELIRGLSRELGSRGGVRERSQLTEAPGGLQSCF